MEFVLRDREIGIALMLIGALNLLSPVGVSMLLLFGGLFIMFSKSNFWDNLKKKKVVESERKESNNAVVGQEVGTTTQVNGGEKK